MTRILLLSAIASAALLAATAKAEPLVLCGWDEVFLLELSDAEKGKIEKLWSWLAADRKELPEAMRGRFTTTDDCKPVDGGSKILISSSSGGCALVERPSGRVLWHAIVPNAHSLELLPRDRVVAASSVSADGNRLILYDLAHSNRPVWETPLTSAHGVVWDEKRECLWALGLKELRCYEPKDWASEKPSFTMKASYPLPDEGGHDLQAIPQSRDLVVTSGRRVHWFDRDQRRFRPHAELGDKENVKCVSVHPVGGRTVFIQGSGKTWWSDTIGLLSPAGEVRLPGERLYKARWVVGQPDGKPRQPVATRSTRAASLPEWTAKIRQDHPRLFFNSETWPEVKGRALGAERAWYDQLKRRIDDLLAKRRQIDGGAPQEFGPEAAQAAFVFLVSGDPRYLDLARQCLRRSIEFYDACYSARKTVNWYCTSRVHAVMAWDWLYNHLAEKERAELMSRLIGAIDRVAKAKPPIYREHASGYTDGFYGYRNCYWFIGCTAVGAGIETETVNRWLVEGHDENLKLLAHRRRACGDAGGGASPTLGYVFGAYPWSEQNFFYTWRSSTGEDIAPDWPHAAWLANYVIWNWIAADPEPLQFGYGDTPHDGNRLPASQLYTHLANVRHLYGKSAPEAAALARHLQSIVPQKAYSRSWFIYPFLLSKLEESPAPLAPEKLPHARHFEGMGQVFMRSGTGTGDTYCLFTCGGILGQHRHYDALNFVIYHRGFLALDSGTRHLEFDNGQHLANYFAQTVAHNCVLIHQSGEPPAPYWGGKVTGCHGGQHRQLGSVLKAFHTSGQYVYVGGDATACYRHGAACGEKAELVTRQIVFLLPRHFVICDRVETTRPEYRKDWLLHTAHKPLVDGRTVRADHHEGRLFCRTLLPADAVLTAVGGPGKEFWAAGENWSIKADGLTKEHLATMGQWRVEVRPGSPRKKDVFLHVVQVGDQKLQSPDAAELLQSEDHCGVRLATGDDAWEITFRTSGELGGHIKCSGGRRVIDAELVRAVQPQSGIR